jgi:hypothetical protein
MTMRHRILAGVLLSLMATTSGAALLGRAPLTPGGTDYQAYYDTVLNITWLADPNFAATNFFGVTGLGDTGSNNFQKSNEWIAGMNAANYLGVSDWRLPTVTPVNGFQFEFEHRYDGSSDLGYNIGAPGTAFAGSTSSELAHLFYVTLGNIAECAPSTPVDENSTDCSERQLGWGLVNRGPFINFDSLPFYWSSTQVSTNFVVGFRFRGGEQLELNKNGWDRAWAVRGGDIGVVPLPAVGWLLAPAFGLFGWLKHRRAAVN